MESRAVVTQALTPGPWMPVLRVFSMTTACTVSGSSNLAHIDEIHLLMPYMHAKRTHKTAWVQNRGERKEGGREEGKCGKDKGADDGKKNAATSC